MLQCLDNLRMLLGLSRSFPVSDKVLHVVPSAGLAGLGEAVEQSFAKLRFFLLGGGFEPWERLEYAAFLQVAACRQCQIGKAGSQEEVAGVFSVHDRKLFAAVVDRYRSLQRFFKPQ